MSESETPMADEPIKTSKAAKAEKPATAKAAKPAYVAKALSALNETKAFTKNNFDALATSAGAVSKGAGSLRAQAIGFTKSRIESNLAAAQALTGAKGLKEVLDIQNAFAKSAIDSYVIGFGKLSETFSASTRDAVKPLSARATTLVGRFAPAR